MGKYFRETALERRVITLERQLSVMFGGLICSWLAILAIAIRFAMRG